MFSANQLSLDFGSRSILRGVSFALHAGQRIALVGRNGEGKSTLLSILSGDLKPDGGQLNFDQHTRVGLLKQTPQFEPEMTLRTVVEQGLDYHRRLMESYEDLCQKLEGGQGSQKAAEAELSRVTQAIDNLGGYDLSHMAEELLQVFSVKFPDRPVSQSSGGEVRRADLARLILSGPDVLMLDEPTNHLDVGAVEYLGRRLKNFYGALLFVSHDRAFIDEVATEIWELEDGVIIKHPAPYERFLQNRQIRQEVESQRTHRQEQVYLRELEWLRAGTPARTTKQTARIERAGALKEEVAQGQDKNKRNAQEVSFALSSRSRLGKTVLELRDVSFQRDERVFFRHVNLICQPKQVYGIIGPNGCGKTTLLKILSGQLAPTSGEVVHGQHLQITQFEQQRESLDPLKSLQETLCDQGDFVFVGEQKIHIASFLERFLFDSKDVNRKVATLSGGEQNRLLMARLFKEGANCLMLDEPTNDLDLSTLSVLEETLRQFEGVVFVVSHDRWFLDRVCTHLLVFSPGTDQEDPSITTFTGNYTNYLSLSGAQKKAEVLAQLKETKSKVETAPKAKKKRSYKEEQEYLVIEKQIEHAEKEKEALLGSIADGSLFQIDPKLAQRNTARITALEQQIETLYARWQTLEDL